MIGERIKQLRKALGLTQQEFADRLAIKRGALANYEIGRNDPIDAVINLICREFDVREEWLRAGEGEMFRELTPETVGARIKHLRKSLDMTQQVFADRLSVSRNNIAGYETDKSIPGDAVVNLICREFDVREEWLRAGEGEMFRELSRDEELAEAFGRILRDENPTFKKRLFLALCKLGEDECEILERFLRQLYDEHIQKED